MAVGAAGMGSKANQATNVGILAAFVAPRATAQEFYRLTV